ncbi:MAG TPA: acyl-CoA dehydrogenase family protein, partial [Terriglobales bacterium]|nr:acyl-CoA dehydrogenase family protein [Terriglobales bacterium]
MATTSAIPKTRIAGGSFLLQERPTSEVFTPEDFSDQHQLIAQTADDFAVNEILPASDKLEHKDWALTRELLKKTAELGLSSVDIPEEYGGADMDKVSSCIIADRISKYAGFAVSWGGHTGIGTLPIVLFGTVAQKNKYLPKLAAGETIGAYALSEASAGSDALNCRARAQLSPDGKHYVLNGEKMWITNAGFADLFTVFAKVDGEKFTAFLVERGFAGLAIGGEEHKMGIRGSSTCPLILNDCHVPVENVLGEVGKGHVIAFNILNIGRYKLGAMCVGGSRTSLEHAIGYAKQRKAFGKSIADFGLIQEKLADMATEVFVGEAMVYRTAGMMDVALGEVDKTGANAMGEIRKAIEEYAVECSILKVWGSEMLDRVVDEVVQIYGGYGFVEEYPAERAYRDARVNRIFEGTNEINRLIITGWLMKRAMTGQLPLLPAIKKLMDEVLSGPSLGEGPEGPLAAERALVGNAKKLALFAAGAASQKYMQALVDQQEVMGALADIVIETYCMESALLRARKILEKEGEKGATLAVAMTQVYLSGGMARIEVAARKVIAAIAEGDMLRTQTAILR